MASTGAPLQPVDESPEPTSPFPALPPARRSSTSMLIPPSPEPSVSASETSRLHRQHSTRAQHVSALREHDDFEDDEDDDDVVLALRGLKIGKATPAPTPAPAPAAAPIAVMAARRTSSSSTGDWTRDDDDDSHEDEERLDGDFNPLADDLDADFSNPLAEA